MLLTSPLLTGLPGIRHGFSTRQGGVSTGPYDSWNFGPDDEDPSAQAENRRRFCRAVGLSTPVVQVRQVHGARVVDHAIVGDDTEADAIINSRADIAVGIRTADCAPILIAGTDPDGHPHVAAVHAGWRGAVADIPGRAIAALASRGATPDRLYVAIGPTIGLKSFEVGDEVVAAATEALSGQTPKTVVNDRGRHHLDLVDLVRRLLLRAGVGEDRIDVVGGCTFEEAALYYSHRRDRGLTGRHLSAIGIAAGVDPPRTQRANSDEGEP